MNNILINIISLAFALGVVIVVHEAGHLLAAKAFRVRVLTFSIGFGKRLLGFESGGTDYRISAVPLGGYVRLYGESPEDQSGEPGEFSAKPRWQRVVVFLAGPAMNVLLSIGLFAVLFMVGIQLPNLPAMPPVIGAIEEGSSAAKAGLARGDRIVSINGEPTASWGEVSLALMTSPDKPAKLDVRRGAAAFTAMVTPQRVPRYEIGDPGIYPVMRPEVQEVVAGKPADRAGLKPRDEIRAVDGKPVTDTQDFITLIEKHAGTPVAIEVARAGKPLVLTVVPALEGKVGKIGVSLGFFQRYPPGQALAESVSYNIHIVTATFQVLGKVFRREMSPKGAVGGPIAMAAETGAAARRGLKELLSTTGFISISIAILNLMPIPVLDGGQIFILLIEGVIRRDLSLRVKEIVSQVGLVLILMLMVVVFYFDAMKYLPGLLPGGS
jgi:regulator of sigma E protease